MSTITYDNNHGMPQQSLYDNDYRMTIIYRTQNNTLSAELRTVNYSLCNSRYNLHKCIIGSE